MYIKRLTAVLTLILVTCSGCQKTDKSEPEKETYATVTFFSDVDFWDPPEWSVKAGTITGDVTEKTGLALDISIPKENGSTKLGMLLANGQLPDIMTVRDPAMMDKLTASGQVWRMDEFLERYCPDSHLLKDFPEDIKKELIERDGAWYAFPSHIYSEDNRELYPPCDEYYDINREFQNNNQIAWNEDLLKAAGLDFKDLRTEEQVMEAFEKVNNMGLTVEGQPVITCLIDGKSSLGSAAGSTFDILANSFGAEFIDEEGNYKDRILQPETRHVLEFLNKLIRNRYVDPVQLTIDNEQVKKYVAEQRVLCFIGNTANMGLDLTGGKNWVSAGPILSSEGTKPVIGVQRQATTGWLSTFISKKCKYPEAVAKWIDYMSSDEGLLFTNYGYEGIDYNLNEEGLVEVTEQGEKRIKYYSKTGIGAWWNFANVSWHDHVTPPPDEDTSEYAIMQLQTALGRNENTAAYDLSLITVPDSYIDLDVKLRNVKSRLSDFVDEKLKKIVLAETDEAFELEYQELIDGVKELGIEELDQKKNQYVQESYEKYGTRLEKVN